MSKDALIFSVDLDDVVYDFSGQFNRCLDAARISAKPVPAPQCWCHYQCQMGMLRDEMIDRIKAYNQAGILFAVGDVVAEAKRGIMVARDFGFRIVYVTARIKEARANTVAWLEANGLLDPDDDIVFTTDKTEVEADVYLDDGWHNYQALTTVGCNAYVYPRPWNLGVCPDRRKDWPAMINVLREMADV